MKGALEHLEAGNTPESFSFARALRSRSGGDRSTRLESLAADYQETLRKGLLRELAPGRKDRGDHLEARLDDKMLRGLTFGDIMKPRGSGDSPTLPYLFMISAIDQSAAIFPHAPGFESRVTDG